MGILLVGRQRRGDRLSFPVAEVTQQQVVRIIPSPRSREPVQLIARIDIKPIPKQTGGDSLETSSQIASRAPTVPFDRFAPFPNVPHSVLAKVEDQVAVLSPKDGAHEPIGLFKVRPAGVLGDLSVRTPIVFEKVESPFDKSMRVEFFMAI